MEKIKVTKRILCAEKSLVDLSFCGYVYLHVYIRFQHCKYCFTDYFKEMSVPMNQAEWVVSIYLMVVCACLLLFGKIGDSFGKIKVYRIGTVIFTIGSLLCGFNQSLSFIICASRSKYWC